MGKHKQCGDEDGRPGAVIWSELNREGIERGGWDSAVLVSQASRGHHPRGAKGGGSCQSVALLVVAAFA